MSQKISKHNRKILAELIWQNQVNSKKCSCRKEPCPLNGQCLQKEVVYNCKVESGGKAEYYTGVTKNTFRLRYRGHKTSFNKTKYRKNTMLSEYIWNIKSRGGTYNLEWTILGKGSQYKPGTKECNLCNLERYFLIMKPESATLNKLDELLKICIHRKLALLKNIRNTNKN